MAIVNMSTSLANALANAIKTQIDAGGAGATFKVYTGTMPAAPSAPITDQVLLGTLTASYPCGTVSGSTLTFSAISQDEAADATGVATWVRIATNAGTAVMDVDASITGGGGAIQFNTVSIVIGGPLVMTSFSVTVG